MKKLTLGLLLALVSHFAFAGTTEQNFSIDSHIKSVGVLRELPPKAILPNTLAPGVFQQDVDHFGKAAGQKFNQRFWIESSYAKGDDAPVFYHICGEGDATEGYFLNDNAIEWAKTFGAHIVYLEHRYYGTSLPFADISTAHLQYLTLDNAIEDLATFQKSITASKGWKGSWITLGGSYSGTLSAIYRQKHPELVVGALAASAPMIAGIGDFVGDQSYVDAYSSTDPSGDTGERQWLFQACRDFVFWQAEGGDFNARLDMPSSWLCVQLFGDTPQATAENYNKSYDAPFIANSPAAPSNILFTYGTADVWTRIGLLQQTNANPLISIFTINGGGHHYDLNAPSSADNDDVLKARAEFTKLAQQWLKRN